MLRFDERNGGVAVFREPSNNTNGNTVDREGRLVSCEHLARRVVRTEHDGSQTVLASHWQGKRLNSPNDVVVHSDGGVWFTDPSYGILSDYEGLRADSEIGACHVYRIDPASGEVERVADDFVKPNGLAFSPDESLLYIADTGASHAADGPRHIRRFEVNDERPRPQRRRACSPNARNGLFDGFRLDTAGPHLDQRQRRRACLRPRRHAARQDPGARARGQRLLRRTQAQPAVRLRHHLALCHHPERQRSLNHAPNTCRPTTCKPPSPASSKPRAAARPKPKQVAGQPRAGQPQRPRLARRGHAAALHRRDAPKAGLKPNTAARIKLDIGTMLAVDGQHGFGQIGVGVQAMELGIARAARTGNCIMTLAHAHHLGRIGHFAEMATAQGLVSMHFVNVLSRPVVAPWGGGDGRFGTNPAASASRSPGADPFVLDYATSRVAQGKMRVAHNKGERVPDGYLIDAQGAPTNDPGVVVVPQAPTGLFGALDDLRRAQGASAWRWPASCWAARSAAAAPAPAGRHQRAPSSTACSRC